MHPAPPARWRAALAAALAACSLGAAANDRPFESARTAVAEDDVQVWSFESWARRIGPLRSVSVEPEYVFDDENSVQVELTRNVDRHGEETGHEAEIEYKHLFSRLARDGWAWGFSAGLGAERSRDTPRTVKALTLRLPVTLDLGQLTGGDGGETLLHLSPGVHKASNARRAWTPAVGAQQLLGRRSLLFAELARQGDERLAQLGLRQWLRREKLGLDIAWQQRRHEGGRSSGWVIGLGWYDF